MKAFAVGLSGVVLLALAAGCRPQLAEVELGDTEEQWNHIVRESYPGFRPPRTAPPAIKDKNTPRETVVPFSDPAVAGTVVVEGSETVVPAPAGGDAVEEAVVVEGTAVTAEPTVPAAEAKYVEYTIKPGDSLSLISKKFYKDGRRYERIYEANKDVIKNPNRLPLGKKIRIPQL